MSTFTDAGLSWTLRQPLADPSLGYRCCSDRMHPGVSCARFMVAGMPPLLLRCAKVYAPIHALSAALGRFRGLKEDPAAYVVRLLKAVAWSALFLASYGNMMTLWVCGLRQLRR
jgi:hypothetical protein